TSLDLMTGGFLMSHSGNVGSESSLTLNLPFGDSTALRATAGYWRDPGFIDSPYLVRVPGVSTPDPDFSDPADVAANLRNQDDVNRGDKVSARLALRTQVWEKLDATLTGFYQKQRAGGRTINQVDSFGTGRYENAERYTEPNMREEQLSSLELKLDLGFAELTSATGYSQHVEDGSRDQTDLLLDFEYGYEDFPAFSAFTHESVNEHRLNQELRLVSTGDSAWQWIVGGFYNRLHHNDISAEFVPGIPEFFGIDRPDNLEFWQRTRFHVNERALFGELGYDFTDAFNVTGGVRWFKYESRQTIGVALPLIDGSGPDEILEDGDSVSGSDDDVIFKANASYKFSRDLLAYFTFSQGYRLGGGNPVAACDDPLPPGQNVCALPSEREFGPDTTDNYEIGVHSKLFDGRLTLNGDLYYVDWKDAQVAGVTVNGLIPIVVNADKARSMGVELAMNAVFDAHWSAQLSYSYIDAELRSDAVGLLTTTKPDTPNSRLVDGKKGDRLPGSPEHMGNASLTWTNPLPENLVFSATYGLVAQGDVLTKAGERAKGEALAGYAVHFASASVDADVWTLRLYVDNLFNKYAETGVRNDRTLIGNIFGDEDGDGDFDHRYRLRRYYHSVLEPMRVGLTFTYRFKF
ncbi:MAG TPA: TonB-dependent receptor, partial [Nevskiaceae bacterium]|nr:TonB-dependent receptor [Nevskiaceae bacterium]